MIGWRKAREQMKRRSSHGRWGTKLALTLIASFCLGSLILTQKQYSRTIASLASRQPAHTPKIAFLFIARNRLPLDVIWDAFFKDEEEEGRFSIYVHSRPGFLFHKDTTKSAYFYGRQVNNSIQVDWGQASMIEAERILLRNALKDALNERFVFLSDSCIPLYNFSYTYEYIMSTSTSFLDRLHALWLRIQFMSYLRKMIDTSLVKLYKTMSPNTVLIPKQSTIDCGSYGSLTLQIVPNNILLHARINLHDCPGWKCRAVLMIPECANSIWSYNAGSSFADTKEGRYNPRMYPVIPVYHWRKGSQWAVLTRKHAEAMVNDDAVFPEFQKHCRRRSLPEFWRDHALPTDASKEHNCIPDEHYVQTLLAQKGLEGEITRRSLTHTSWDLSSSKDRERRGWHPVTYKLSEATPKLIKTIKDIDNINYETEYRREWCSSRGKPSTCFLFARKFTRAAALRLLNISALGVK